VNKCDLAEAGPIAEEIGGVAALETSALTGAGIAALRERILALATGGAAAEPGRCGEVLAADLAGGEHLGPERPRAAPGCQQSAEGTVGVAGQRRAKPRGGKAATADDAGFKHARSGYRGPAAGANAITGRQCTDLVGRGDDQPERSSEFQVSSLKCSAPPENCEFRVANSRGFVRSACEVCRDPPPVAQLSTINYQPDYGSRGPACA